MRGGTIWTILGVIVAIVIAWFLVNALLSLIWFIAKLAIVLVVAAIVFFALRAVFSRPSA
jgi:hypothetical protein